jgi:3-dehydroquinate dehydratase-2
MQEQNTPEILIIHGPNLNMLGKREPELYGTDTLEDVNTRLIKMGDSLGLTVNTFQSNHEGEIVEKIQQAFGSCSGVIINPAALTHTSVAIRDALLLLEVPIVEVHISNIHKRETFRHTSMIADVSTAQLTGFGVNGYLMALNAIADMLQ